MLNSDKSYSTFPKLHSHCDLTFPCTQAKISPPSHPPENVKKGQRHDDLNLVGVGGDNADIDAEVRRRFVTELRMKKFKKRTKS